MRNLLSTLFLTFLTTLGAWAQADEVGIASYYDDSFHGRKTASGELYNKNKLTAAHRTLPYGTIVKVTRLDNKKSVRVRINDRGPYLKGRIVDLSRKAAERLDIIQDGHAKVQIEVVGKGAAEAEPDAPVVNIEAPTTITVEPTVSKPEVSDYSEDEIGIPAKEKADVVITIDTKEDEKPEVQVVTPPPAEPATTSAPHPKAVQPTVIKIKESTPPPAKRLPDAGLRTVTDKNYKAYDLYKVQLLRPAKAGFGVQIASITQYENVLKRIAELQGKWFNNILVNVEKGSNNKPVYKIILGPFGDRDTAESYKKELKKNKKMDGFVVDLSAIGS